VDGYEAIVTYENDKEKALILLRGDENDYHQFSTMYLEKYILRYVNIL